MRIENREREKEKERQRREAGRPFFFFFRQTKGKKRGSADIALAKSPTSLSTSLSLPAPFSFPHLFSRRIASKSCSVAPMGRTLGERGGASSVAPSAGDAATADRFDLGSLPFCFVSSSARRRGAVAAARPRLLHCHRDTRPRPPLWETFPPVVPTISEPRGKERLKMKKKSERGRKETERENKKKRRS